MLLLYLETRGKAPGSFLFTFHYASTLSNEDGTVVVTDNIYIPLCFYFIGVGRLLSEIP